MEPITNLLRATARYVFTGLVHLGSATYTGWPVPPVWTGPVRPDPVPFEGAYRREREDVLVVR